MNKVLICGGDVGGMKALTRPFSLIDKTKHVDVVDHRDIKNYIETYEYNYISIDQARTNLENNTYDIYYFSTSVSDSTALELAEISKSNGVDVYCILDNWMNYKSRLVNKDNKFIAPNKYFIMDELAKDEAVLDGICPSTLTITGQPSLDILVKQNGYSDIDKREIKKKVCDHLNLSFEKELVLFISEPCALDQGRSLSENPNFRGYTEEDSIREILNALNESSNEYNFIIVPHPRQVDGELDLIWDKYKGNTEGGLFRGIDPHDLVASSDIVTGMASILLYIAWLLGKKTCSVQPNLINDGLRNLEKRDGIRFLTNQSTMKLDILEFLNTSNYNTGERKELLQHINSKDLIMSELFT